MEIILIGLLTGTLIGTVGIGGILLAPLLVYVLGMELHIAQATSSFSFLFTAIVGISMYARHKSIDWHHVLWISLGIIPAALLGARVNSILSGRVLTLILAALIVFSGYHALSKRPANGDSIPNLNIAALVLIGLGVGFGSSLTGTGGPVLLLPILLFLQFLPLAAVGISQAIQLPIAVFATTGFMLFGRIDFRLGLALGFVQALGVILGATISHTLPQEKLRVVVALTLIAVGLLMIGRVFYYG